MVIYKISSRKWIDEALTNGSLRIGTIYYYKQFEDDAIGDSSEGLQPYLLSPKEDSPIILGGKEADRIFKQSGFSFSHDWRIDLGTKGKLLIDNIFNTFIYCCSYSESNTPEVINDFGDSFFIITDPDAFAHMVGQYIGLNILPKFKTESPRKGVGSL